MTMTQDEKYMARCLSLAELGRNFVAPNPMVGAIIVHNDTIIGEGWHQQYGETHAERNAIYSVENQSILSESTLYVNLEPCAHFGNTPPCADLIITKKIKRVVIGCLDPNPKVSGKGVALMRDAGICVKVGVLENESRELNKRFIILQEKKRPFVLLKWAQTADGFIDYLRTENLSKALRISNDITTRFTHKMRAENMGIMVGTNTILLDNPLLTVRYWCGKNPTRITFDKSGKIPADVLIKNGESKTIIFSNELRESSKNVKYIFLENTENNLQFVLNELGKRNIHSILVEGGAKLLNSFIRLGLWDEAQVETSTQILNNGVKSPVIQDICYCSEQIIEGHSCKHITRTVLGSR